MKHTIVSALKSFWRACLYRNVLAIQSSAIADRKLFVARGMGVKRLFKCAPRNKKSKRVWEIRLDRPIPVLIENNGPTAQVQGLLLRCMEEYENRTIIRHYVVVGEKQIVVVEKRQSNGSSRPVEHTRFVARNYVPVRVRPATFRERLSA